MDQIAKDETMTDEEKKEQADQVIDELNKEFQETVDQMQQDQQTSEQLKDQMQQAQNQMNQNQQQQNQQQQQQQQQQQDQQKPSDSSSEQDKEEVPEEEEKSESDPSDGTGVGEVNGTVWDPFGGSGSVEDYLNNNSGHVNNQTDNSKADDELSPEEQEFINNYLENLQGWGSGLKK
jgi:chromosome segregation ATPase